MNKRSVLVLCTIVLIISNFAFFVMGQTGSLPSQEELENDTVVKGVKDIQEFAEEKKWEYLSEKWKETLLKNSAINLIDSSFKKINFVFFFLFGQDYELSLDLFVVFLLWIFFLGMFEQIINGFSTFGRGTSFVVALCLVVIAAHLKFYSFLATLIFKLIFFKEGYWKWVSFAVFFILYLVVMIYLQRVIWVTGRKFKKSQEEKDKWDEKFHRQLFEKKVEGVEKGLSEVGEAMSA